MAKKNQDNNIESTLLKRADQDQEVELQASEWSVNDSDANESLESILANQNVDPIDEFDDLEAQLELAREEPKLGSVERRQRNWLIFTGLAFSLAILSSFLISPALEIERERQGHALSVVETTESIRSLLPNALSSTSDLALISDARDSAARRIDAMTSKESVVKTIAGGMFGHTLVDAQIRADWQAYDAGLQQILDAEPQVQTFSDQLNQLNESLSQSLNESVVFVEAVTQEGQSRGSIADKNRYLALSKEASDMTGLLSRLSVLSQGYASPTQDRASLANEQLGLVQRLSETLTQIQSQAAAGVRSLAEPLEGQFTTLQARLSELTSTAAALSDLDPVATQVEQSGTALVERLQNDLEAPTLAVVGNALGTYLPIAFALLGGLGLLRYSQAQTQTITERDEGLSQTVAQQQDSILKLLDEMSALADGDLTIEAEVTDQITGAIADSVNFAVVEMRQLVSQINDASERVAQESETAVQNANNVSLSNRDQAEKITQAAQRMTEVADQMRTVSEQATRSSQMAKDSIEAATQGTQAVRDTIRGMEDMREQIQDTSKRIKRLGESSQRIGDIVALIDDIAEQTNILSLNAAIQASMAGEAGRGFAVVSNEVQNLAERSTEATKRIAELVQTIQNDTNDAVLSMEKATEQVVSGTRVADSAGAALSDIDAVSKRLSELVEEISSGSTQQAQMVNEVSDQVSQVSQSSSQTSEQAEDSATSIAKLLELSRELETSVSRFKLPESSTSA